ncbi:MAG: uroporphyrinogen decarboxylase family protein [Armatimonadota bacterium]
MRFHLDIDYPLEQAEMSRRRMEARQHFAYVDRVPVGFCLVPRYFTPLFDIPYCEYFRDVETHYYWQLQFAKYRIERIPEDMFCTGPTLWVYPFFDNVLDSDALGAETVWPENETLQACPTIHTVEAMEAYEIPPPTAGLWGRQLEWCERMKTLATETRATLGGEAMQVVVGAPSIGGLSPHMLAVDLVGVDFYWWLVEYPEACHRFLDKITRALIQTQEYFERIWPRQRGGFGVAEDSAQIMSLASFREFCVPYDRRLYDALAAPGGDFGVHMCGDSTHLHPALVDDLPVTDFNIFGYLVPPQVAARTLGGKMRLWGNINPMLMLNGTREEVLSEATQCLNALAPCGGLLLGDGANVCPGTPLENLAALTQAAEEYGLPQVVAHL